MSYSFVDYPSSGPDQGLVKDLSPAADPGSAADALCGSLKRLYDKSELPISQARVSGLLSRLNRASSCILFGDSNTIGNNPGPVPLNFWYRSLMDWTLAYAGSPLWVQRNAGISGNTTTQMLARIDADVIAYLPAYCIMGMVSQNDYTNSISLATSKSNILTMIAKVVDAGIKPILLSGLPNETVERKNNNALLTAWLAEICATNGYLYLDVSTGVIDIADGTYSSGSTSDNIHPTVLGWGRIATYTGPLLRTLLSTLPPCPLSNCSGNPTAAPPTGDPTNLVTNSLFSGTTIPVGWSSSGTATRACTAMMATEGLGNWCEQTVSATTATVNQTISTTLWSPGDTLEVSTRVWSSAEAVTAQLRMAHSGGPAHFDITTSVGPSMPTTPKTTGCILRVRYVVPATTALQVLLQAIGTGTVGFGQMTVRNISRL